LRKATGSDLKQAVALLGGKRALLLVKCDEAKVGKNGEDPAEDDQKGGDANGWFGFGSGGVEQGKLVQNLQHAKACGTATQDADFAGIQPCQLASKLRQSPVDLQARAQGALHKAIISAGAKVPPGEETWRSLFKPVIRRRTLG